MCNPRTAQRLRAPLARRQPPTPFRECDWGASGRICRLGRGALSVGLRSHSYQQAAGSSTGGAVGLWVQDEPEERAEPGRRRWRIVSRSPLLGKPWHRVVYSLLEDQVLSLSSCFDRVDALNALGSQPFEGCSRTDRPFRATVAWVWVNHSVMPHMLDTGGNGKSGARGRRSSCRPVLCC